VKTVRKCPTSVVVHFPELVAAKAPEGTSEVRRGAHRQFLYNINRISKLQKSTTTLIGHFQLEIDECGVATMGEHADELE
jgi:hypothetical protein